MKKVRKSFFCVLCTILMLINITPITVLGAETIYVSKSGDDRNDGSQLAPMLTVQAALNKAMDGDTIQVAEGIYTEEITMISKVNLVGEVTNTTIMDGNINFVDGSSVSKLTVNGLIKGTGGVTIDNNICKGGIEIIDDKKPVFILKNTIYFNSTTAPIGIKITGTDDNTKRSGNYVIGKAMDNNVADENMNTFISEQTIAGAAIEWPFLQYQDGGNIKEDILEASLNYWKNVTVDLTYGEVQNSVKGKIKFYTILGNMLTGTPGYSYDHIVFEIDPQLYYTKDARNTATGFEFGDHLHNLYRRTMESVGFPVLDFTNVKAIQSYNGSTWKTLENPLEMKYRVNLYKKDVGVVTYPLDEFYKVSSAYAYDKSTAYFLMQYPMVKLVVQPNNLVAYANGTSLLTNGFPAPSYDFYTNNVNYDSTVDTPDKQYFHFEKRLQDNTSSLMVHLKDINRIYNSWGTAPVFKIFDEYYRVENDLNLDSDHDGMPFNAVMKKDGLEAVSNQAKGIYQVSVENAENIDFIMVDDANNRDNWQFPIINTSIFDEELNPTAFFPDFLTSQLTVRHVSNDTSITSVQQNQERLEDKTVAIVDQNAIYTDSGKKTLQANTISLFNDNQEPDVEAYNTMLKKAQENESIKNVAYSYHHLALVNKEDGNNIVTTDKSVKIYIPYPTDYANKSPISIKWFQDYHRMPSDDVSKSNVKVIQAVTYLDHGFVFDVENSELGSFIIAYSKKTVDDNNNENNPDISQDNKNDTPDNSDVEIVESNKKTEKRSSIDTKDNSSILVYLVSAISLFCFIIIILKLKKKNSDNC